MKFKRKEMIDALKAARSFTGKKAGDSPETKRVLIDPANSLIFATDYEAEVKTGVNIESKPDESAFCIEPTAFIGVLEAETDDDISISTITNENLDESVSGIRVGKDFKKVNAKPFKEYSGMQTFPEPEFMMAIDQEAIKAMCAVSAPANSVDPTYTSIGFNPELGYMVSTDAKRLHHWKIPENPNVPVFNLKKTTISKCLSGQDPIRIGYNQESDEVLIATKKVKVITDSKADEVFDPAHFLNEHKTRVKLDREALLEVLGKALILTDTNLVTAKLTFNSIKMLVEMYNPESGKCEASVQYKDPENMPKEPFEIGINPIFMTDTLTSMYSEFIWISFDSINHPIIFKPDAEKDRFTGVIMPSVVPF